MRTHRLTAASMGNIGNKRKLNEMCISTTINVKLTMSYGGFPLEE